MHEEILEKARRMFALAVELEELRRDVEEAVLRQGGSICTEKLMDLARAEVEAKGDVPEMPSRDAAGIGIRLGMCVVDAV